MDRQVASSFAPLVEDMNQRMAASVAPLLEQSRAMVASSFAPLVEDMNQRMAASVAPLVEQSDAMRAAVSEALGRMAVPPTMNASIAEAVEQIATFEPVADYLAALRVDPGVAGHLARLEALAESRPTLPTGEPELAVRTPSPAALLLVVVVVTLVVSSSPAEAARTTANLVTSLYRNLLLLDRAYQALYQHVDAVRLAVDVLAVAGMFDLLSRGRS
jgi:hypothetical protein